MTFEGDSTTIKRSSQVPTTDFAERVSADAGMPLRPEDSIRWLVLEHLRHLSESTDTLRARFAQAVGLHPTDLDAVSHLSDGAMPMGRLGQRLSLTPGAITAVVDRLERVGHVRRLPSPTDRRQTLVELTPPAQEMVGAFFGALAIRLMAMMDDYSEQELAVIERFLAALPNRIAPPDEAGPR